MVRFIILFIPAYLLAQPNVRSQVIFQAGVNVPVSSSLPEYAKEGNLVKTLNRDGSYGFVLQATIKDNCSINSGFGKVLFSYKTTYEFDADTAV